MNPANASVAGRMVPVILMRADANRTIGSGHVVRLLLLAHEFLGRGCEVVFLHRGIPREFESSHPQVRFIELDPECRETEQTLELIDSFGSRPRVLVTDGDQPLFYDEDYQRAVRRHGALLMTVTFFADGYFHSDIILNQNVRAPDLRYEVCEEAELLLGLRYAVLDRRFAALAADPALKFDSKKEVLMLFFGGADATDSTRWVLSELRDELQQFETVHVVVGALYAHLLELKDEIRQLPGHVHLHHNTREMPNLMAESKYAVVSGGLTIWELACTKTAILCLPYSERELLTCEVLSEKGLIRNLGPRMDLECGRMAEVLRRVIEQPQATANRVETFSQQIDGNGAGVVADKVLKKLER